MDVIGSQWMDKCKWYNTTIFTKLNGQSFEDDTKTGLKDRYELMCAVDAFEKEHVEMHDGESGVSGIPITSA